MCTVSAQYRPAGKRAPDPAHSVRSAHGDGGGRLTAKDACVCVCVCVCVCALLWKGTGELFIERMSGVYRGSQGPQREQEEEEPGLTAC